MNYGLLFCVLACVFYAGEVVMVDKWLSHTSPIMITMLFGAGIAIFAVPGVLQGVQSGSIAMPSWKEVMLILGIAFVAFLADWFHFAALNQRVGAVVIATSYVLIPVACSIMKWESPSLKMIVAWILGGIALYLISDELKK